MSTDAAKAAPFAGGRARARPRVHTVEVDSAEGIETYPLCEGCAGDIARQLGAAEQEAARQHAMYASQLEALSSLEESDGGKAAADHEAQVRAAQAEEAALLSKSAALAEEEKALRAKGRALDEECRELEELHAGYWREFNDLHLRLQSSDRDSLRRRIEATQAQVDALNKTNVINDAFHIAHTDMYATINGFRLGSLQSQPVEWDEINAAWGYTVLLVQTLASHWDFTFPSYRLVPMGSFSRIFKRDDDKLVYDLYCASDIGLSRIFGYGSFDKGMCAFLECVRVLQDHVRACDASVLAPPYRISDNKIEDLSIKLQFNTYDKWTRALKYMLANLKWLVAASVTRR